MTDQKTLNLSFTARVGSQNRLVIDPNIVNVANISEGDMVSLILTQVYKKTGEKNGV
jgi:hypothetical protein